MKKPSIKMPTTKISELKFVQSLKPKPVFNRPFPTDGQARVPQVIFIGLLSFLIALSIVVIGLKAVTVNFMNVNNETGFYFQTGDPEPTLLAALPKRLFEAPAKVSIVVGVFSILVAAGHITFAFKYPKKTETYSFRRNTMFVHLTNAILILLAMVAIFVTHKSSSRFSETYVMRKADRPGVGVRYNVGMFDLETWSCELKTVQGAQMVWTDYSKQCAVETAGRAMTIPWLIIGMTVAALGVIQMIGCRREEEVKRMEQEGDELEMGKFNAL